MSIRCGNCGQRHGSAQEVQACYANRRKSAAPAATTTAKPATDPDDPFAAWEEQFKAPVPDKVHIDAERVGRLTPSQQKYLSDLLNQLHLVLADAEATVDTLAYAAGKEILDKLIAARRNQATGQPYELPDGVAAKARRTSARAERTSTVRTPYPDVPAGHYATKSRTGRNDLDFWRVDRPEEGTWAGRTFVKRVIGGRPDSSVRGAEAREALEAILKAGVAEARKLYGQEVGRCWRCNRHLTDELSRQRGIGPDCYEMLHG